MTTDAVFDRTSTPRSAWFYNGYPTEPLISAWGEIPHGIVSEIKLSEILSVARIQNETVHNTFFGETTLLQKSFNSKWLRHDTVQFVYNI